MTNLFDLRLIGETLYLYCKLSQITSLFVCMYEETTREGGGDVRPTSILKDDTFNLVPAEEIKSIDVINEDGA